MEFADYVFIAILVGVVATLTLLAFLAKFITGQMTGGKPMEFDFEELMADMLGVSDEAREDPEAVPDAVFEKFGIHMEEAYKFASALLKRTPKVQAGLTGKLYHAFVNTDDNVMLMKIEAK